MDFQSLYAAIDAKPFRPFSIELVSGTHVAIQHPENVFILPSRQKVRLIEIYHPATEGWTFVYPEGVAALHLNGSESRSSPD